MQEEISLKDLYLIVKKHLFTMFSLTLVGAILALVFMNFFVSPKYKSESQILVNQRNNQEQAIQYNEIQSNIQLINTYRDIITGQQLLNEVSQTVGGNYKPETLRKAISVTQSTNSQAFTIKVVLDDPALAQKVLAQIVQLFEKTIREIYENDITNLYTLLPATFDPNRVSPSAVRYLAIGAILGLGLSIFIVLLREMMDTTIKDEAFLQQIGLTKLGEVYTLSNRDKKNSRLKESKETMRRRKV
ncbi:hypothetical protein I4Q36_07410 [Tuanshanicoccus lijuaniae]|uniref:YveK family protein n=1 Tax=Aerococcaceae bacterium zg-1292 TaxID=2774330 RepID=UPI001937ABB9|nr:hypothetical protein [Aerococcaceae bacterium zg-1292]QQA36635.1 hypothetical protein I4Q36_07410 [Aerococcaceae bacterium zg-1292]